MSPSSPAKRKQQYERKKKRQEKRMEDRKKRTIAKETQFQREREKRKSLKILPVPYEVSPRLIEMSDEQWEFCKKQRGGAGKFLRTIVDQYRHGEFPSSGGLYWYVNNEFSPKIEAALIAMKAGDFSGISEVRQSYLDLDEFLKAWHKSNTLWGLRHEF